MKRSNHHGSFALALLLALLVPNDVVPISLQLRAAADTGARRQYGVAGHFIMAYNRHIHVDTYVVRDRV